MVKKLIKKFNPKKKDLIIDVGSNDGVTLDQYPKNNTICWELNHLQSIMLEKLNCIKKFFNFELSNKIKKKMVLLKLLQQQMSLPTIMT